MRLWLPEKASARPSIKGFVGAGCIFSRHRVDVSQAAVLLSRDFTYDRRFYAHV